MSNRLEAQARVIHPRALKELGEEACIVALGVARDLRSGVIPPEEYDQTSYCGSACCIAGHITARLWNINATRRAATAAMFDPVGDMMGNWWKQKVESSAALAELFHERNPSDPILAADAIERFVYGGADEPWKVPAMTGG